MQRSASAAKAHHRTDSLHGNSYGSSSTRKNDPDVNWDAIEVAITLKFKFQSFNILAAGRRFTQLTSLRLAENCYKPSP
jgi:hypothetical protein